MQEQTPKDLSALNGELARYMELFACLGGQGKLFPKYCRTCGRKYNDFVDYVVGTVAKAHCLEDCSEVMGRPFTMMYRHCRCGNTLVLTITDEEMPSLDDFWEAVARTSEACQKPRKSILLDFALQCEIHLSRFRNNKT